MIPGEPGAVLAEGAAYADTGLRPAGCPACGRTFLVDDPGRGGDEVTCPGCAAAALEPQELTVRAAPPELVLTTDLDDRAAEVALRRYVRETRFACRDLDPDRVAARMRRLLWPMWLVDADVDARWEAQVGFDYQVKSSREIYRGNAWHTQEVLERRIRWEDRVGRCQRRYDNAPGPAVSDHRDLLERLGDAYDHGRSAPWTAEAVRGALMRLPDLEPEAAWPEAEMALRSAVARDVRVAAGADHVGEFSAVARYANRHWTWLLLPMWVSHYTDDAGVRHLLEIHGQTGRVRGVRAASVRRGLVWAAVLAAAGLALGLLGGVVLLVGLALWPLLLLGLAMVCVALLFVPAALWPAIAPWWWNRRQGLTGRA